MNGSALSEVNLPPHSDEAELGILGCAVLEGGLALRFRGSWFYDARYRVIARTLKDMAREGAPVSPVTLYERLKGMGVVDQVGGMDLVVTLDERAPAAGNFDYWRAILEEKDLLRKVLKLAREMAIRVEGGCGVECVDQFKAEVNRLGLTSVLGEEGKPVLSIAQDAINRYEWMSQNVGKLGVPTGIPDLDKICGGWKPGHTVVVAGETGGGKSTFGLHSVLTALRSGIGVVLFSLEMGKEEIFDLMISNLCGIDRNKFNTGAFQAGDMEMMAKEMPPISRMRLYIEDSALSGVDEIKARVYELKSEGKIGLVVVDYIQFVNPGLTQENREQQVAGISHELRALARESKLPMIVLSQLNDEGRLRESRVIAHNANVVMKVEVEAGDRFKVTIVKGRGIPTGEYYLDFNRRLARLSPLREVPSPPA
jgi:replicative DNA helicase